MRQKRLYFLSAKILAVGSWSPHNAKAEWLDVSSNVWENLADYPYGMSSRKELLVTQYTVYLTPHSDPLLYPKLIFEDSKELIKVYNHKFYNSQIVHKHGQFFVFGGMEAEKVIAMLDIASKEWSRVGSLNEGRYSHRVVVGQNDFIIVSGDTKAGFSARTERCVLKNDEMSCEVVTPTLTYFEYPEAMLVDKDFCLNN